MSSSLRFEDLETHTVCRYTGAFEGEALLAALLELGQYCARRGIDRVLFDVHEAVGDASILDLYRHGERTADFWSTRTRLAILLHADHMTRDRVWQTVTRNRGMQTFVSTEADEVTRWLLGETAEIREHGPGRNP